MAAACLICKSVKLLNCRRLGRLTAYFLAQFFGLLRTGLPSFANFLTVLSTKSTLCARSSLFHFGDNFFTRSVCVMGREHIFSANLKPSVRHSSSASFRNVLVYGS